MDDRRWGRRLGFVLVVVGLAASSTVVAGRASAASSSVAPFRSAEALVRQQYRDLQAREATPAEAAAASSGLAGGTRTAGQVVDEIAHLGPGADRLGNVTRLYTAYFQRLPDAAGLDYWVNRSELGWTLNRISANFAGSSEFTRKYGTLTNAGFVDRAFENVFGRPADPSGRTYWTGKLDRGTSRGVVMVGFSQSNEYRRKQAPTAETVLAYRGLLRRMPTTAEATAASAAVAADGFAALAQDLLARAEYAARFPAPRAPGGLTAAAVDDQVTVRWDPAPAGPVVAGYTLRVLRDGVPEGTERAVAADTTSAVVSGLADGGTYAFSLAAHTADRDGPTATTAPLTIDIDVAWGGYQGGAAHDGVQRRSTIPAAPSFAWEADLDLPIQQVVVGDDRIFAVTESVGVGYEATGSSVYALDPADGSVLWGPVVIPHGAYGEVQLGYEARRLFVANDQLLIQALDSRTGTSLWTRDLRVSASSEGLTVWGGTLYVFDEDGLLAIDVSDGSDRWHRTTEVGGTPAADASGVYFSHGCGVAYRFTHVGAAVWRSTPNCQGGGFGVVTLAEGRMWPSGYYLQGDLIRNQALGTVLGQPLGIEAPAVLGSTTVYDDRGVLRGTDTVSGAVRWSQAGSGWSFGGAPVINAGRVYARSGGLTDGLRIRSFDVATGAAVWNHAVVPDLAVSPPYSGSEIGDLVLGDGVLLVPVSMPWPDLRGSILAYR